MPPVAAASGQQEYHSQVKRNPPEFPHCNVRGRSSCCPIRCPQAFLGPSATMLNNEKPPLLRGFLEKPTPGFEPGTPSLRVKCSGQLSYVGAVPMLAAGTEHQRSARIHAQGT